MLKKDSKKVHPELDMECVENLIDLSDQELPSTVTSASQLLAVERFNKQFNGGRLCDLFVFGIGEPENSHLTKIGGNPVWPKNKPWPKQEDGTPFLYFAQLNFTDSADLFDFEFPSNVAVLMVDSPDWIWGGETRIEWISDDCELTSLSDVPRAFPKAGPFYGVIHRTMDSHERPLPGMKFGGYPPIESEHSSFKIVDELLESFGDFAIQIASVQPETLIPYPFVNEENPLPLLTRSKSVYEKNCIVFGDMGTNYFYLDEDGEVATHFETH